MIRHTNDRLLTLISNKLHFILHLQDGLVLPIFLLLARSIPESQLNRSWISFLPILAQVSEFQSLLSIPVDRLGARENPRVPAFLSTMQRIWTFLLLGESVRLAIQVIHNCILDAVACPADGGAKVRGVVFLVVLLGREALDNVVASDAELLDDAAQGEECESGFLFSGGHFCLTESWMWFDVRSDLWKLRRPGKASRRGLDQYQGFQFEQIASLR